MAGLWRTGLVGAAAGLAVPVGAISGVLSACFGAVLLLAFVGIGTNRMTHLSLWGLLTSDVMLHLIHSLAIFVPTFFFLATLQRKAKALVSRINTEQGLSLDSGNLLGYPSPGFLAFDQAHRALARCNSVTGDYHVHDFAWVLSWRVIWRDVERMEANGGAVNPNGIIVPTFGRTVRAKDFALELEVANPQQPLLTFYMSQRAAETWSARLNALFSG